MRAASRPFAPFRARRTEEVHSHNIQSSLVGRTSPIVLLHDVLFSILSLPLPPPHTFQFLEKIRTMQTSGRMGNNEHEDLTEVSLNLALMNPNLSNTIVKLHALEKRDQPALQEL